MNPLRIANTRGRGIAALAAVVLGLAACASGVVQPGADTSSPAVGAVPKLSIETFPLPVGFDQPATLVGDPNGSGSYFLAESRTDARVFHWDGQQLTSWSVGDPATDTDLVTGIQNSIAAVPGVVWVGVNSTLIRLDTATGETSSMTLPAPSDSSTAENLRPAEIQGYNPVIGLAVAPDGDVAVIRDAALDIEVRDARTGKFTRILVASSSQPASIAYDRSGTLAVDSYAVGSESADLSEGTLQLVGSGDASTVAAGHTAGGNVMPLPNGGFIVVPSGPTFTASLVTTSGEQTAVKPISPIVQLAVEGPSAVVTEDSVAVGSKSGIALFDSSSGTEEDVNFPTSECEPGTGSMPIGGTTPSPLPSQFVCAERSTALSVDADGTIWSLTSGPQNQIAEVAP